MRRVSFAEASDVFWLVLFPDEPNREAAIQGWALEMLHHPDPNQGPALRKIEQPNPDLADRISLTIEGRTLTLGVTVGSGEDAHLLPASHAYAAFDRIAFRKRIQFTLFYVARSIDIVAIRFANSWDQSQITSVQR